MKIHLIWVGINIYSPNCEKSRELLSYSEDKFFSEEDVSRIIEIWGKENVIITYQN